jgi:acid stress-induced BolA-like protein IbaG/YrbA
MMSVESVKPVQKLIRELIESSMNSHAVLSALSAPSRDLSLQVIVESDDEIHFQVIVISELFTNQSRVKRTQLVYAALSQDIMDGRIHAIALKTYTPEEWANLEDKKND